MVRLTSHPGTRPAKRPKVAVVYEDITVGFRFADWYALHGYQAILTSAVHQLERNLQELCPGVIVVGYPAAPTPLHSTVPRLRITSPQVPIIAMVNQSGARPLKDFGLTTAQTFRRGCG